MHSQTMFVAAVLALACTLPPTPAAAQLPTATVRLDSGATIRIAVRDAKPRVGQFVSATNQELRFLAFPSDLRRVARGDIERLEIRSGVNRMRGARRGAIRTGVVFGVIGALLGWGMSAPGQTASRIVTAGSAGAGFGVIAGGLVGAAIGSAVWAPAPYPEPGR